MTTAEDKSLNYSDVAALLTVVLSIGLFGSSLMVDTFYIDPENPRPVPPVAVMIFGWLSMSLSWWANPVVFISWLPLRSSRRLGFRAAVCALCLALWFLTTIGDRIMTHENGGVAKVVAGVGPGYWLWGASMAVLCLGGGLPMLLMPKPQIWLLPSQTDDALSGTM